MLWTAESTRPMAVESQIHPQLPKVRMGATWRIQGSHLVLLGDHFDVRRGCPRSTTANFGNALLELVWPTCVDTHTQNGRFLGREGGVAPAKVTVAGCLESCLSTWRKSSAWPEPLVFLAGALESIVIEDPGPDTPRWAAKGHRDIGCRIILIKLRDVGHVRPNPNKERHVHVGNGALWSDLDEH